MTTTITDPYAEFLKPDDFLSRQEQTLVEEVAERDSSTLAKAAVAMAAGFLVYRWFMQRKVKELMKDQSPSSKNIKRAMDTAYKGFQPHFVQMLVPHLITGYIFGMRDVRRSNVAPEFLIDVAETYAANLGKHMHEVTADAMVSGYQAQLNRKVPPARALQRTLEATGVSPRVMNTLVTVWTSEDPKKLSDAVPEDHIAQRAKTLIYDDVMRRGKAMGDNESWSAKEQGKQIVWMYGMKRGAIPKNAKRRWVTAKDELVCPSCGPLHGKTLPLNERFDTELGKSWTPPLHVNCRCEIELVVSEEDEKNLVRVVREDLVAKARGDDPYARDKSGKFASHESRGPKTAKKPKTQTRTKVDPQVQAFLREHNARSKADVDALLATVKDQPKDEKVSLNRAKLASIERVQLPKVERVSLNKPQQKATIKPTESKVSLKQAVELNTKASLGAAKAKESAQVKINAQLDKAVLRKPADKPYSNYQRLDTPLVGVLQFPYMDSTGVAATSSYQADYNEPYVDVFGETYMNVDDSQFLFDYDAGELGDQLVHYWDLVSDEMDEMREEYGTSIEHADWDLEVTDEAFDIAKAAAIYGGNALNDQMMILRDRRTGTMVHVDVSHIVEFYDMNDFVADNRPVIAVFNHSKSGNSDKMGYVSNPGLWRMERVSHTDEFDDDTGLPYVTMSWIPADDDEDYFG